MKQPIKKRALGRGLDALLADKPTQEVLAQARPLPISKIKPNQYQPRSHFDQEELGTLTESIRRDGVLMPILVRPAGDGFELIAGERRWRASQAAGLKEIPAVVREVNDLEALELAIVENEQRDDLTAIESARAYQRLMAEFGQTQQQVAERIGVSRVQVSNIVRLLQLPENIQEMIEERKLDMGHARPLVGLQKVDADKLARQCMAEDWSVRRMEQEAKRTSNGDTKPKAGSVPVDADITALQEELSRKIGLRVQISCNRKGAGELKIKYSRPEELDGVLSRLRR